MENTSEEIIMNGVREAIIVKMNSSIKELKDTDDKFPVGRISDGYHTFDELYEHRYVLWLSLCKRLHYNEDCVSKAWKSKKNGDGSGYEGYFILGWGHSDREQITYHLPVRYWDQAYFATEYEIHPYDGHTSADVLERLKQL